MPTVIGLNQVPPNTPRPTAWDYWGQMTGAGLGKATDALLAVLGARISQGGQRFPNPFYGQPAGSATLNFPGGAQTQTNPQELAQIQSMGGVPTQQGTLSPYTTSAAQPPLFPSNQKTITMQDIERAKLMQDIKTSQEALNPNSPKQLLLQQKVQREKAFTDYINKLSSPQSPLAPPQGDAAAGPVPAATPDFSSLTSPVIKKLAESGDPESLNKLRRLALELDDEEAIAALTALGEL